MADAKLIGIAVVVIIVLAAAAFFTLGGEKQQPPQQETSPTAQETTTPTQQSPSPSPTPTETTTTVEQKQETTTAAPAKDTLVIAIGTDMDTPDPHGQTTTTIHGMVRHVYETLLWYDDEGNLIPWLAERWEVSEDGLVYTFYLRKGVYFSDGTEFDAYAVKANVDRWINPNVKVPTRSQLGPVKGAEVVDKYTVRIILEKPYGPFLQAVANYLLIGSPKSFEKYGNDSITDIKDAIGTGPYKFAEWKSGQEIVMVANENWWRGEPKIKKIVWRIIPEAGTREAALLAGDVDVALYPPPSDLPKLKEDPNIQVYTPLTNRILFVALHPVGPLQDVRVRQAINYAVDKQAIVENVLFGLGIPADAPLPPHFFGYAKQTPYEYNPEKAKQLLAEAGYADGFKMVLLHPTGRYLQDKQVAEAIQAYLQQVGIEVELKTGDWPTFVRSVLKPLNETDFDAVLVGWGPLINDAHFTLYAQFHSSQAVPKGLGLAYYSNPEVDKLLEQALSETDPQKRKELYAQAQEIIWKDAPWLFLYTQANLLATSKALKDVFIHPNGEQFFFWDSYFE